MKIVQDKNWIANPRSVCMHWVDLVQEFGVRTDLQISWFHQVKVFLSFLIHTDWSYVKIVQARNWIRNPRTVWILNFAQEFGVRTDLQRSWFHRVKLFLNFLMNEDWSYMKTVQARNWIWDPRTVCIRWVDLELCTGVRCKNGPVKELVPPSKALPEFLDPQRLVLCQSCSG